MSMLGGIGGGWQGGAVQGYAEGGPVAPLLGGLMGMQDAQAGAGLAPALGALASAAVQPTLDGEGPLSNVGKALAGDTGLANQFNDKPSGPPAGMPSQYDSGVGIGKFPSDLAKTIGKSFGASKGGKIPGKAPVKGNSPNNDTVPAMLSPGEIVVPRSHSSDPEKAAAFARAVAMRHGRRK